VATENCDQATIEMAVRHLATSPGLERKGTTIMRALWEDFAGGLTQEEGVLIVDHCLRMLRHYVRADAVEAKMATPKHEPEVTRRRKAATTVQPPVPVPGRSGVPTTR
jgi:hypothetical protein